MGRKMFIGIALFLTVPLGQISIEPASASSSSDLVPPQVSAGGHHTCAITVTNTVQCWGDDRWGEIDVPSNLGKITQLSLGGLHTCALTFAGAIRCWGNNDYGQINVPPDLGKATLVKSSDFYSCALLIDQSIRCWGWQMGFSPYWMDAPSDLGQVKAFSVGQYNICAVRVTGSVRCWGHSNDFGQDNVPQDLGLVNDVVVGDSFGCALLASGHIQCWGMYTYPWYATTVAVTNSPDDNEIYKSITAGGFSACALSQKGEVKCWGWDTQSVGSDPGETDVPAALGNVTQITSGSYHNCALNDAGKVACWGSNVYGESTVPQDLWMGNTRLFAATPIPNIVGSSEVQSILLADPGVWDSNAELTYQWLQDGSPIPGATSNQYKLSLENLAHSVKVSITGTAPGYMPSTQVSDSILVTLGILTRTPAPKITGSSTFGFTLTANPGTWDPGVELTYQWLKDAEPIEAATTNQLVLKSEDVGHLISVVVTGSRAGYESIAQTNVPIRIQSAKFTRTPLPLFSGALNVGSTLTANAGDWDDGVSIAYCWQRDNVAISGATANKYVLSSQDLGHQIRLQITATAPGYTTATTTSSSSIISAGAMTPVTPRITGLPKSNMTIKATVSSWVQGAKISYQWLLDGKPIKAATKSSYTLLASQKSHKISLSITENAPGYLAATSITTAYKVG